MKLIPHCATPTLLNAIQSLIWVGTLYSALAMPALYLR